MVMSGEFAHNHSARDHTSSAINDEVKIKLCAYYGHQHFHTGIVPRIQKL